jgi:hypothetical protein
MINAVKTLIKINHILKILCTLQSHKDYFSNFYKNKKQEYGRPGNSGRYSKSQKR